MLAGTWAARLQTAVDPLLAAGRGLWYTSRTMPGRWCHISVVLVSTGVLILSAVVHGAQAPLFGPAASPGTPLARLDVAITAGTAAIVPGRPVALSLDMRPARGIHVYAPGNAGYIPVSVTLTVPAGVQVHPAVYPAGEDYVFGDLKEIVKVYSRAFPGAAADRREPRGGKGRWCLHRNRGLGAIPGVRRQGLLSPRHRAGQYQAADRRARADAYSGVMSVQQMHG